MNFNFLGLSFENTSYPFYHRQNVSSTYQSIVHNTFCHIFWLEKPRRLRNNLRFKRLQRKCWENVGQIFLLSHKIDQVCYYIYLVFVFLFIPRGICVWWEC